MERVSAAYIKELSLLSLAVIESQDVTTEVETVKKLSSFFSSVSFETLALQKDNERMIAGGLALSSYDAAICLDDYIRTARFLKGTYQAICQKLTEHPHQPVHILYAGCGPYATLLTPLLPLFEPDQLDCIFLEIHEPSAKSAQHFLKALGLDHYKIHITLADATRYQKPVAWPMHILLTETMFNALTREPQVSVTMNLAKQMEPGGILIPEAIHIDLVYTFAGKEPYLKNEPNAFDILTQERLKPYAQRLPKDRLFSINKELNFLEQLDTLSGDFKSKQYTIPASFDQYPDICLFTQIDIFGKHHIGPAESYITNLVAVTSFYSFSAATGFELVYQFRDLPKWSYQTV